MAGSANIVLSRTEAMNALFRLSLIIMALMVATSEAATDNGAGWRRVGHYAIYIPAGYVLDDVTPQMADFELLEIRKTGVFNERIGIYFGNAPNFPKYDWGKVLRRRHG